MKTLVKFYRNNILKDITYFKSKEEARHFIQTEKRKLTVHQKVKNNLQWHIA